MYNIYSNDDNALSMLSFHEFLSGVEEKGWRIWHTKKIQAGRTAAQCNNGKPENLRIRGG